MENPGHVSVEINMRDGFEAAVRGMFLAEACHVGLITTVEG